MKVGDLVKFGQNDAMGIIVDISPNSYSGNSDLYHVRWFDGVMNSRFDVELEVISESR